MVRLVPAWLALPAFLLLSGCVASDDDMPLPPDSADAGVVMGDQPADQPGDLLPFMAECTANAECESELCFEFNNKGPHCSHTCALDSECEAPSPGCNNKGICKAPD